MAENKTKIPFPMPDSPPVDATEVLVRESTERWSEVQLEDGSTLRVKPSILGAVRVDGSFDPDGNPMYSIKAQLQVMVAHAPKELRKENADAKIH